MRTAEKCIVGHGRVPFLLARGDGGVKGVSTDIDLLAEEITVSDDDI